MSVQPMTVEMAAGKCTGEATHSFKRAGVTTFSSFAATECTEEDEPDLNRGPLY
jgi:hypothetical protein